MCYSLQFEYQYGFRVNDKKVTKKRSTPKKYSILPLNRIIPPTHPTNYNSAFNKFAKKLSIYKSKLPNTKYLFLQQYFSVI